ncbi:MAG: sulfur carrier protein ThiS [Marinilabiliaceae bacterium]|nr:sulfur carrier protein ThiS [Marinilabiliaceae bacterium]
MNVIVNGQDQSVADHLHVDALLAHMGQAELGGIAVAINDVVVPKGQWKKHLINDGDKVLIIKASQGG